MSREKKFTPGPWHSCHKGKCTCKMVWSMEADHPVAKIEAGDWGDTYPVIKDGKPAMESIPYGSINEDTAIANANLIAAAPELLEALEEMSALLGGIIKDVLNDNFRSVKLLAGAAKTEIVNGNTMLKVAAIKKAHGETE